jgi:NAD(P)-dependent dehydrogenase (short-subunit alcohol dehydrogenase family)
MLLEGRVAIITGAGPGLGRTLALTFAREGADLALAARTTSTLERIAAEVEALGRSALMVPTDVTRPEQAQNLADRAFERFGRVDILVNSAFPGTYRKKVLDMGPDELEGWRKSIETGGYGTLLACRFVAPYMVRAGRGAIVNVTSMSSQMGYAGRSDYAAGKAAVHLLSHALADELGPEGIRVNCVAPGHIWSDTLKGWYESTARQEGISYEEMYARHAGEMALRRIATEQEVANAILYLASDLSSGTTGGTIDVNAGHLFN